jgi:hypothetical protein
MVIIKVGGEVRIVMRYYKYVREHIIHSRACKIDGEETYEKIRADLPIIPKKYVSLLPNKQGNGTAHANRCI